MDLLQVLDEKVAPAVSKAASEVADRAGRIGGDIQEKIQVETDLTF